MKITDDVREYAAQRGYAEEDAEKVLQERRWLSACVCVSFNIGNVPKTVGFSGFPLGFP